MDDGKDAEAVQTCEYGAKLMDSLGEAAAANDEQRAHDYAVTAYRPYGMLPNTCAKPPPTNPSRHRLQNQSPTGERRLRRPRDNADVAEDRRSQERLKRRLAVKPHRGSGIAKRAP
ncbi:MAG: hypothetical protein R3F11_31560 [Verrucomicrobiales bacterium]